MSRKNAYALARLLSLFSMKCKYRKMLIEVPQHPRSHLSSCICVTRDIMFAILLECANLCMYAKPL